MDKSRRLMRQIENHLKLEDMSSWEQIESWVKNPSLPPPPQILSLCQEFPAFLDAVDLSYMRLEESLSQAQRTLSLSSAELEDMNKILRREIRTVSNLLNNMRQSIFVVSPDLKIIPPVSHHSSKVFGTEVEGQPFFDLIFQPSTLNEEVKSTILSTLITIFGEDQLQWELSHHKLPARITMTRGQILKAGYAPIWDEKGELEQLLCVFEDISSIETLQQKLLHEQALNHNNHTIMLDIIRLGPHKTQNVLTHLEAELGEIDSKDIQSAKRIFHAIKGNARALGLKPLAHAAHEAENLLDNSDLPTIAKSAELARTLIAKHIANYQDLYQDIFQLTKFKAQSFRKVPVSEDKIEALREEIRALSAKSGAPAEFQKLEQLSYALSTSSLLSELEPLKAELEQLSNQGLKKLRLVLPQDDLELPERSLGSITVIIEQLVRNAIDHGLESSAERLARAKPKIGQIIIEWMISPDSQVQISIKDDGRGIDPNFIREFLLKSGKLDESMAKLMTDEEIQGFIWQEGFSTAQELSQTSGRGVGLNMIRHKIRQIAGDIFVQSSPGIFSCFTLSFPLTQDSALEKKSA